MEAERSTFVALVEAAYAKREYATVCALCELLWAFYLRRSCYPDWIRTHELAVRAARALGDSALPMLSRMLVQLARPYLDKFGETPGEGVQSNRDTALEHIEAAVRAARASGHGLATLTAVEALGKWQEADGDPDLAVGHHREALAIAEALDPPDARAVMNARHQVGRVELARGRLDVAGELLETALREAGDLPRPDGYNTARISTSLGDLYHAKDALTEAIRCWGTALDLHERAHDGKATADLLAKRGRATPGLRGRDARDDLARAHGIYRSLGYKEAADRIAAQLHDWDQAQATGG